MISDFPAAALVGKQVEATLQFNQEAHVERAPQIDLASQMSEVLRGLRNVI